MTRQAPPMLWLKCGSCNDANLATMSHGGSPRTAGSMPLPGEDYVVQQRRDGRMPIYPRSFTEFTYKFECRPCGASHKVSGRRLAGWWAEFTAARRQRDVRYLGRDR